MKLYTKLYNPLVEIPKVNSYNEVTKRGEDAMRGSFFETLNNRLQEEQQAQKTIKLFYGGI